MQNKKVFSIFVALLVSVGLWVYVMTVENPEDKRTYTNIPVVFTGEEQLNEEYGLLITDINVPNGVSLTISGKLSDLNKLTEYESDMTVRIDVSKIRKAQDYVFTYDLYDIGLPGGVSAYDISLSGRSPAQVSVSIEKLAKRFVPVKVLTEVDIVEGYVADRLTQDYTEIEIQGPADSVSRIDYAQAVLRRENVDQTITSTLTYQLIDIDGEPVADEEITSEVTEVQVTLPILMYKDVPLEVPVIDGGGASAADTLIDIEPKQIRLSADPAILAGVESIMLSAVDLSTLVTNNETVTRVISVPEGCNNLSGEQSAEISVQIKNKAVRQMRISSSHFTFVGVPSTLQAVPRTSVLPITIRANENDINLIVQDNIRVIVDFSNVALQETSTSMTMPVKIRIDGFEGAGVINEGEHTVVIDLVPN